MNPCHWTGVEIYDGCMGRKGQIMWRKYKKYDEVFKRKVLDELVNGTMGYTEVSRHYGLSSGLLSQWIKRFGVEPSGESEEGDMRALKTRVAELERMVGRLTMENDFLKKFAAFTKQRTNERSSVVTPKTLASPAPAGSLGLPEARTTMPAEAGLIKPGKTSGSKSV